jgi:hypothetical protein
MWLETAGGQRKDWYATDEGPCEPVHWLSQLGPQRLARVRTLSLALPKTREAISAVALGLGATLTRLVLAWNKSVHTRVFGALLQMKALSSLDVDVGQFVLEGGGTTWHLPLPGSLRALKVKHDDLRSRWLRLEWPHWSALTSLDLDGQFFPVIHTRPSHALRALESCELTLGHKDERMDESVRRSDVAVVDMIRHYDTARLVSLVIAWPCASIMDAIDHCMALTCLIFLSKMPSEDAEVASLPHLRLLRRLRVLQLPLMHGRSLASLLPLLLA